MFSTADGIRNELFERLNDCKMRITHLRRGVMDGWRNAPGSFVEYIERGRYHSKAAVITDIQRTLLDVQSSEQFKKILAKGDEAFELPWTPKQQQQPQPPQQQQQTPVQTPTQSSKKTSSSSTTSSSHHHHHKDKEKEQPIPTTTTTTTTPTNPRQPLAPASTNPVIESEQRLLKWCTTLVRNCYEIEDKLTQLLNHLISITSSTSNSILTQELIKITGKTFSILSSLQSIKKTSSSNSNSAILDVYSLEEERRIFLVLCSRIAVSLAKNTISYIDDEISLIHAPTFYWLFANGADIPPPPSTPTPILTPLSNPSTPIISHTNSPLISVSNNNSNNNNNTSSPRPPTRNDSQVRPTAQKPNQQTSSTQQQNQQSTSPNLSTSPKLANSNLPPSTTPKPIAHQVQRQILPQLPPGDGTDGAWQYTKSIVDEIMQDSLLLEGCLFVENKSITLNASSSTTTASAALGASSGVLSPRWFTNRDHIWMLQYYQSEKKGSQLLGSIDLSSIQTLSFINTSSLGGDETSSSNSGRSLSISLTNPSTTWILTAASERDAIFWMLGLKRIILDSADGSGRLVVPLTSETIEMSDDSILQSPCADSMLQMDYTFILRRLDDLAQELLGVEQQLRHINTLGERLQQQFFSLARKKSALQHLRERALDSLSKVESQMASRRGGGTGPKKPHSSKITPIQGDSQPEWGNAIKLSKPSSQQSSSLPIDIAKGAVSDWMLSSSYKKLAVQKVVLASELTPVSINLSGPEPGGAEIGSGQSVFAKVISCYPLTDNAIKNIPSGNSTPPEMYGFPNDRELSHVGDPICDRFAIRVIGRRVIATVADGCNWGAAPQEAATRASLSFADFVLRNHHKLSDTRQAGDLLLVAIAQASDKISEGKDNWQIGTTTLAGGILLETDDAPSKQPYVWVCVSLGDCKVFHYSVKTRSVVDVTENNRLNLTDPSDPGGRLGPHLEGGNPDLRNLRVQMCYCDIGDLIFLCSDGVHDNFDPQHLGDKTQDWKLPFATWEEASDKAFELTQEVKSAFRVNHMKKIIAEGLASGNTLTPKQVATRLVDFSYKTTASSRKWMYEHSKQKLPTDFVLYPGKLDHCSCLCFRVGGDP